MSCLAAQADGLCLLSNELMASCSFCTHFLAPSPAGSLAHSRSSIQSCRIELKLKNQTLHVPNSTLSYLLQNNIQMHFWATAISGTVLFGEPSRAGWVRSRQRASATMAPFLPVLIICLAIGRLRQQQLSPHGLFPEFKVIGGENAIVLLSSH